MPMKMVSSTIIDLRPFVRRRDLHPGVSGSVGRSTFSRYGPSDLASPDQSWIFSHGCREEYYPRNICLGCYILGKGDSCSRLSNNIDQAVRLFFPGILVLVLLPIVIDYFNGYARARSLGIAVQIKLWDNLRWYFQVYGSVLSSATSRKYKIVSWKNKEFEDLEDLLVSFRLYFIIVKISSCISTIYDLYGIDCQKNHEPI
jgi:hypothetical protein